VLITIRQLTPPTLVRLSQWLALFKQPRIVLALSVTFWQYAAQFLIYSYIAPLLQKNAGLDGTGVSLMLFVAGVAGVLGNNLGGRIADRWSLTWTLCLELIGIAVCMFILPAASVTALGAGLILFVWCLIGFIFNPVQQARLIGLAPQSPGPMLSLNSSMLYLGNAAGAGFGGIIVSQWSLNATAWVGGILALVGLGALGWSVMQHQSPAPVASHTNEPVMND
jgi:DHA1 family putative efflux transporter-like MFS transporter